MTVAITSGPLALEAVHVWTPADGGPQMVMHDLSSFPRVEFKTLPVRGLPAAENNKVARNARIGNTPLPSMVREHTMVGTGLLRAKNVDDLRQLSSDMEGAFGERNAEGTWAAIPVAPHGDPTKYWETAGRVLQYDPAEEASFSPFSIPSGWQRTFTLGIERSDPRWTWVEAQTASAVGSAGVVATNLGTAPAEPTLTVPVAGSPGSPVNVSLINDTLGKELNFNGIIYTGNLVVEFATRRATVGANDVRTYLNTFTSNWQDRGVPGLRRGANTLHQVGGTGLQVDWRHTSW